jgi:hypothetical protein
VSPSGRSPRWSVLLTALAGAWIGHFVEYVRVAGWHAGLVDMTSSVHSYFLPAGAALVVVVTTASLLARRAWIVLGRRLRAAEVGLWRRPKVLPSPPSDRQPLALGLFRVWTSLTALQVVTWVIQENLEAMGGGHRAPLLGVMSGVHWLAPVMQAEVALILAVVYWVVHRWFAHRRSRLVFVERLVSRRWSPCFGLRPSPSRTVSIPSAPVDRWGAQTWQRPPPFGLSLI